MSSFVDVICAVHRKDSLCMLVHWFCISRKGGTGGGVWDHPQGDMHVVAVEAVEMPWLALGGLILGLFAQIGLKNTAFTL